MVLASLAPVQLRGEVLGCGLAIGLSPVHIALLLLLPLIAVYLGWQGIEGLLAG